MMMMQELKEQEQMEEQRRRQMEEENYRLEREAEERERQRRLEEHKDIQKKVLLVLFLISGPKWVICPAGGHVAPINVPHAKFHVYQGKNLEIQPQYCEHF